MPYRPEHKAETRARIISSARRLFNRRGFTEVSIDEIMQAAGLTRGGFYNHFATKDELYAEAISEALRGEKKGPDGNCLDFDLPPEQIARHVIATYLSEGHLKNIDGTCALVALPSDAARAGPPVKRAYRQVLTTMVELFQTSQNGRGDARQRALAIATLCVGGMVLARAIDDETLGEEIRSVALTTAFEQGGWAAEALTAAE
jgi:AcrR family transcriptional regulator